MPNTIKILAISGSTRAHSTNGNYIKAIAALGKDLYALTIFDQIAEIPHFNPDLDTENAPEKVNSFRQLLREADGIVICTPEYAMGVPGTLKNAIDWTVSSCEFSHKPTVLITASSLGQKGHASLMETLKIIEARITDKTQLVVSFAKTKINSESVITDEETLHKITLVMHSLLELIRIKKNY